MTADAHSLGPFNSPLESGLRALFLLAANAPRSLDLQRLVYYDYLLVHSGDVDGGPASLHPATPHRSGEWLVRRETVKAGLTLMVCKELAGQRFGDDGITYAASNLTAPFLTHFHSEYATLLKDRAAWAAAYFAHYPDKMLEAFMTENVGRWGAEFKRESILRGSAE